MNNLLLKQLLTEYDIKRNKAIEEAETKKLNLLEVGSKKITETLEIAAFLKFF